MSETIEWGDFRIDDLFTVKGTKPLDRNAIKFLDEGINFVGRTSENNGIQGKIKEQVFKPNESNTITATVIGNYKYVKFQKEPYYCSQNINKLTPKDIIKKWNAHIANYFVSQIQKFVSLYDNQQSGYKLEELKNYKLQIPIKDNEIDYQFIEKIMIELEKSKLLDLKGYLESKDLTELNLTYEEQNAITKFDEIKWSEFQLNDLFMKVNTKKVPFKAKELPTVKSEDYNLPCLTSSFINQGLNYFVKSENVTILNNVISLPSNSDVYRAYFQSMDFTILSDAYAIEWKFDGQNMNENQYLFAVQCINKVTDLPTYSYKNKLGGWNIVKYKYILLPVIGDNKIDYDFMNNYVTALKKIIMKNIVEWYENKLSFY
ncbi:restriction endonuclease subunit S [Staphylococcus caeli]|uniref:BcgI-like restriction enzyme subunit beta n=1 Tax=Staphylococcus caeli TaxID=2201815 RepID=A0A1D4KJA4_9STAP|nr:restriction endonuclease subunit S [Staphylococcus caeli]SCS74139.1 BcgI-like restriction enzyme subunit beta [Staphylococcus caeli]SCS74767.1 BcgI-like restriction enzyme subunit beta [Staphylococcus caeli]